MRITSEKIKGMTVRLNGLPWHWVPLSAIFGERIAVEWGDVEREVEAFAALSKDAPYQLTAARLGENGWETFNLLDDPKLYQSTPGGEIYLPVGFCYDVAEWNADYPGVLPKGRWYDFYDSTKENDGVHRAKYVGPMWWVVEAPSFSSRVEGVIKIIARMQGQESFACNLGTAHLEVVRGEQYAITVSVGDRSHTAHVHEWLVGEFFWQLFFGKE